MAREKLEDERYSPIVITEPNTGDHALAGDWSRELLHPTLINGQLLTEVAKEYNNFVSDADVEKFFNEVVLGKVVFANPAKKQHAVDYLKATFHQGGFLQPASTPLSWIMQEKMAIKAWENGKQVEQEKIVPYAFASNPKKQLEITTSLTGVEIKEIAIAESLMIGPDFREAHPELFKGEMDEDIYTFTPDAGQEYVLQTDCSLTLDFTNLSENNQPHIQVGHNFITFGNEFIKSKMEQDLLFAEFKIELNKLETSINPAEMDLYRQGMQLINQIKEGLDTREPKTLREMSIVLDACLSALTTQKGNEDTFKENIAKLAKLSQKVSGHCSPFWKKLGAGLLLFAGLALVAVGVLAAIPSGGASLLAAVLGAAGVNAAIAAGTTVAGIGAMGAGFFKHENSTGLAKSVSEFKDKLISARQEGPEHLPTRHNDSDSDLGSSIANSSESSDEDSAPPSP
jgi:hypothetical protein